MTAQYPRRVPRTGPALAAALAVLALAPPAPAVTRDELTSYADRVAARWAERQARDGAFLDPATDRPSGGYGNAMLGYSLMRAGERRGDAELVRAGVRGVDAALDEDPAARGVFDLLAVAAAYNVGREFLPDDAAFTAARARWEEYLRATGPPNIDNKARACIEALDCFHNHEAVEATANLELLATGVEAPGLGDPVLLRSDAITEVGVTEPAFASGSARIEGPRPRAGLGLLSDTGTWPLAYHALSTAMLTRSVELLGEEAPATSRAALRRTGLALAGFMAPDGSVAYIGHRQEVVWSLAAAIVATQRVAPAAADRAFGRLTARYPLTAQGLPVVPRSGRYAHSRRGVDGRGMVFNGLALYLLNVAADEAPERDAPAAPLPADADGAFVDPDQNGFAAVRRGDVWFAVRKQPDEPDLRNDFGLVAAKWRSPSGRWVDVVRPRPFEEDADETAGPVVERGGERLPLGGPTIAVSRRGSVRVDGPVPLRFAPVERGVRISLRADRGDVVTYTAYLPEGTEPTSVVGASAAPELTSERGLASCCDIRMVAARLRVPVREGGPVAFRHAVPAGPPAADRRTPGDDGPARWPFVLAALALVAVSVLAGRRLKVP